MPITPDTKDWTWVLERACPECGFDVRTFPRERTGELIRANAALWRQLLDHPLVDRRPSDDRWSGLEYACHVRDVFRLYDERLRLMVTQEDPLYPNWDQDTAAIEGRYDEQNPDDVASELSAAAYRLADSFDAVDEDGWRRTGRRSDGVSFTVESFARYLLHDPVHHVNDVEKGYAALG
ncbi:MAG TPA: DinB family protein [Actinomycetota bacterium]|nr:DinB family protein [Actinomycetota bacterium]